MLYVSKEALPKRRIWVNMESLVFVKELSISFINCAQEGASLISKQGALNKRMRICFTIKAAGTKWIQSFLKAIIEFMLRPRRILVRYLIPLQLWQLNTLFGDVLINFNKFFLKALRLVALQRLRSNFFHSITVDGQKIFWKSYV